MAIVSLLKKLISTLALSLIVSWGLFVYPSMALPTDISADSFVAQAVEKNRGCGGTHRHGKGG